ncbi:Heat-labile enterotoxin IIA, B chain [Escherichia coli]|uniref:Heat-labile enterotoxin type II B subunit n=1 Tax=Escherichia coli TaxID=562 RepID=H6W8F9_ECOLX|nr:Heat-labile enterotoxin IIA, B chain [Escherichia coli]AET86496.1 heat-labile enterotoxin type II B subunit precursor [Escherichia coli]EEY5667476.1 Heat-labile enterotoxin IIA, B chain [Escherichia coli]EFB1508380.1 Heat-labile enterotoxin IIA, B chain [Escherichia coli]EFC7693748.1 Heat-labile enterotoxin IIA, B chain [Escherichia coli]EFD1403257.1 Heat-labile enterotoxin IIA, B chain [Escherichia coli]
MNFKKSIALLFVVLNITSLPTYADVSKNFKDNCGSTTAKIVQSVRLVKLASDTNKDSKGIYITDSTGKTRFIPGGQYYPENYLSNEMRKIAMAAVLSNVRVNICASEAYTPNHVWAIELAAE